MCVQVVSVHVNPLDGNLVMSAGNDHTARIFDLRLLTSSEPPAAAVKGAFKPTPQIYSISVLFSGRKVTPYDKWTNGHLLPTFGLECCCWRLCIPANILNALECPMRVNGEGKESVNG